MMAARFRSVTWVSVALVPALACYLVTQHVAAERAELAKVERKIGQTRRAIRDLQTELGTRGSMAQIERWNGQTFALAAPTPQQFIAGTVQLASLTALPALPRPVIAAVAPAAPGGPAVSPLPNAPAPAPAAAVQQVAFRAAPAARAEVHQAAFQPATKAARAEVSQVTFRAAPAGKAARGEVREIAFRAAPRRIERIAEPVVEPLLRQANYMAPARDQARVAPTRVALLGGGPLDAGTLADIGRIARTERGGRRP